MLTHLAGTPVSIGGRWIQRCLICGMKLLDTDERKSISVMVMDGQLSVLLFPVGAWVFEKDNSMSVIDTTTIAVFDPRDLPDYCCLEIVE